MWKRHPVVEVEPTTLERTFNVFTLLIVIGICIYILYQLTVLPAVIPTHYGAGGKADGWGSKYWILLLLAITVLLSLLIYCLSKRPHLFNYMNDITEDNAQIVYPIARKQMACMNLVITIGFSMFTYLMVQGKEQSEMDSWAAIGFVFFGLLVVAVYYGLSIWQAVREWEKRKES